jgi:hypothetical protein
MWLFRENSDFVNVSDALRIVVRTLEGGVTGFIAVNIREEETLIAQISGNNPDALKIAREGIVSGLQSGVINQHEIHARIRGDQDAQSAS